MVLVGFPVVASPVSAVHAGQAAETRQWGDTARAGAIAAATRRIDDEAGDWRSIVTRDTVPGLPTADSAEVRMATIRGRPARIVAQVSTQAGRYSVEFYLTGGMLLLAYETLEYAEARAPPDAWRNAAGNAAWERRTWFLGGAIVAARTTGREGPSPGEDGDRLARLARSLAALFNG